MSTAQHERVRRSIKTQTMPRRVKNGTGKEPFIRRVYRLCVIYDFPPACIWATEVSHTFRIPNLKRGVPPRDLRAVADVSL